MIEYTAVNHSRFRKAQRQIFFRRVTPDCMDHSCSLVNDGHRVKLDACCQYGAQTDLFERDAILTHADQIRSLLRADAANTPWFSDEAPDKDFASGSYVRTNRAGDGCVFLAHDLRGCAIHRASVEGGWDFDGVKPHVCRLFPLSYESDAIVVSDDYADYSCAYLPDAPTLYRVARDTLAAVFGGELAVALDAVEASLVAADEPGRATYKLASGAP